MELQLYWVSAITYAFVLGSILFFDRRVIRHPNRLEQSYRIVASWVIFFLFTGCSLGIVRSKSDKKQCYIFPK